MFGFSHLSIFFFFASDFLIYLNVAFYFLFLWIVRGNVRVTGHKFLKEAAVDLDVYIFVRGRQY